MNLKINWSNISFLSAIPLIWYAICSFIISVDAEMMDVIILFTFILGFYWLVLVAEELNVILKNKGGEK